MMLSSETEFLYHRPKPTMWHISTGGGLLGCPLCNRHFDMIEGMQVGKTIICPNCIKEIKEKSNVR